MTKKVENINHILTEIFKIAETENIPTYIASARFSERSQNLPEKDQEEDAAVQEIAGVGPVGNPNRQHH